MHILPSCQQSTGLLQGHQHSLMLHVSSVVQLHAGDSQMMQLNAGCCITCRWRLQDQCVGCDDMEGGANRAGKAFCQAPCAYSGVQWQGWYQQSVYTLSAHGIR